MAELLTVIKRAAIDAVEAQKPMQILYGTVTAVSPLAVQIDQKFTLPEKTLIVPEHLTEHKISFEIDDITETADQHTHRITGRKEVTLFHALETGQTVALLRMQGGQKYMILDRVVI